MKIKYIIPFVILFALLGLLWRELFYLKQNDIASGLIGETVPTFTLRDVTQKNTFFTERDLKNKVSLLNVWATWC